VQDHGDTRAASATGTGESAAAGARPRRRRIFSGPLTVEAYLRANSPPRYMQRLREMETEYAAQRRRLDAAYEELEHACPGDADGFAARWGAQARGWRFDRLNELIREHNAWYPVEADLPMDPRTRDYVAVHGESYRRRELGPDWILEHFPADRVPARGGPSPPRRVPREHVMLPA
jgi:hypothetical protein